jgi:acyl-coenzyme A thioesterase PaaI-like protein
MNNIPLTHSALSFQKKMKNPFTFWLGMFFKLPSAIFWRFQIKELNSQRCVVSIPYSWTTQNPFKSIYFAALAGAAELTTGALCQLAMSGKGTYSMLVVDFRGEFFKKADEKILFSCVQGEELMTLLESLEVNDTGKLKMISSGKNKDGIEVARFYVTWSFRRKS